MVSKTLSLVTTSILGQPPRGKQLEPKTSEAKMEVQRLAMVAEIKSEAQATASYTDRPQLSARVLDAMAKVERHRFVPSSRIQQAYANMALPIQCDQTISQPFIVALMTDLLDLTENLSNFPFWSNEITVNGF